MARVIAVAEYRDKPSEGMQVVSKTLVDALRRAGHAVHVIEPRHLTRSLLSLTRQQPDAVLFTHGPGAGVVAHSWLLRKLLRARIVWIASRPDLAAVPRWLKHHKTAHSVICNRRRVELESVARDADFIEQFIGINPARVVSDGESTCPWPELIATGRPVLLHVGHLRRNRGLDVLAAAKRCLGEQIEVVVQGGPALPTDPGVVEELESAGVRIRRAFEPDLNRLYKAADLYVFPVNEVSAGAIELPLGVLEAVACGTPVLATDFGVLKLALKRVPGVTFCNQAEFLSVLRELLENDGLKIRPTGLPDHLHADRTTEAVLRIVEALPCAA